MVEYDSIAFLAQEMTRGQNLDAYSFAYVDMSVWQSAPASARIYLPTRDEDEDEDEDGMPLVVTQQGLRNLLSIADLEGVVSNFRKACPNGTTAELIDAINHYREYDAYKYLY